MILIAGASGEIGCYLARKFVQDNLEVIALDKISCNALSDTGIKFLEVDFSDETAVEKVWNELHLPKEVTIFNLIGNISSGSLLEIFGEWDARSFNAIIREAFEDNFFSVVSLTMSFARLSFLKGISSNIVNFGSVSAEGILGQLAYGSAKGAVHAFSRIASVELGIYGVRVNCLIPGYVDTPKLYKRVSQDRIERIIAESTINKLVSLDDVFLAAKFLHYSKTVNGSLLEVHSIHGR